MGLLVDRPLYWGIGKMENDRIREIISGDEPYAYVSMEK